MKPVRCEFAFKYDGAEGFCLKVAVIGVADTGGRIRYYCSNHTPRNARWALEPYKVQK